MDLTKPTPQPTEPTQEAAQQTQQPTPQQANNGGQPPPPPFRQQYQNGYPVPPTQRMVNQPMPNRTHYPMTHAERVFAIACLIFGFCFVRFLLINTVGLFTSLFFLALVIANVLYLRAKSVTLTTGTKLGAVFLGLFSSVFVITTSETNFWAAIFLICGNAYLLFHAGNGNKGVERFFFYALMKSVFEYPLGNLGMLFRSCNRNPNEQTEPNKQQNGKKVLYVLIGLVLAIPLTCFVAALLISADERLGELLSDFFYQIFKNTAIWVIQFVIGIPAALFMFGAAFSGATKFCVTPYTEAQYTKNLEKSRFIPNLVLYSAITPVCCLYVLFFLSQLRYFCAAFFASDNSTFDYAQYARQGFFELCVLAVINLAVLVFINYLSKEGPPKKPFFLRLYSGFLAVSTLVIIASALSKMVIYMDEYGLTRSRLYASWFMLLLALVFLVVLVRQFVPQMAITKPCFYIFLAMFTALCFMRTDALIATYNINNYAQRLEEDPDTRPLDIGTLFQLSDEAYVVMIDYSDIIADCAEDSSYARSFPTRVENRQKEMRKDSFEKLNLAGFRIMVTDLDALAAQFPE